MPSYEGAYSKSKGAKPKTPKGLQDYVRATHADHFVGANSIAAQVDRQARADRDFGNDGSSRGKNRVNSRPGGAKQHRDWGIDG